MISKRELRDYLSATYKSRGVKKKREDNIIAFNNIDRDGYCYSTFEKRILLYASKIDEKIYVQLPGKESIEKKPKKLDFRPKLQYKKASMAPDTSFRDIWEVIDQIAVKHRADLPILAAVIFRVQTMYDYTELSDDEAFIAESIKYPEIILNKLEKEHVKWHQIKLQDSIWEKLEELFNDTSDPLKIKGKDISFEAFIKYSDLLVQNEDCKYYEKKKKVTSAGRRNTCGTILSIIFYYEGHIELSALLSRFRQGIAAFKVADYPSVTDGIIKL